MKLKVKNVIIVTKKHDRALIGMTREVAEFILCHSTEEKEPYTMYKIPK
jgi:hypothetical protein